MNGGAATNFAAEARTLVSAACFFMHEDSGAVMAGSSASRARVYAFVALAHRHPNVRQPRIMEACGADSLQSHHLVVTALQAARHDHRRGGKWFNVGHLNEILAEVGWPPMTARQAEVRRLSVSKKARVKATRIASEEYALVTWIADLMERARVADGAVAR